MALHVRVTLPAATVIERICGRGTTVTVNVSVSPVLEMNPDDATGRALIDGMWVKVWNDLGEVFLPLRITRVVRGGVVCSEKGAWLRTSPNGQTVSALAPTHKADLADGACYNDARVEVTAR